MARKAVFDLLQARTGRLKGRIADVAAGSGAFGFEALSRGASEAVLVDTALPAVQAINRNAETLGVTGRVSVRHSTALRFASEEGRNGERFSIIFFDPPYEYDSAQDLVAILPLLLPGGFLVHERGGHGCCDPLPGAPSPSLVRRYGKTSISLYEG
jgi:16S rRNA (guanine966-N2)-methyltransferase